MTLDLPVTVHVEKPATTLANAMKEMRTWLDNTALEPVVFKIAISGVAGITFDVTFRTSADAIKFEQAFT